MIVSGGLGTSIAPIRFMSPPEVLQVTVRAAPGGVATNRILRPA